MVYFSVEEKVKMRGKTGTRSEEEEKEDANKGIHNGRLLESEITLS